MKKEVNFFGNMSYAYKGQEILYVPAIFDCFDSAVLGLSIGANMQATLCADTLDNAMMAYPDLKGAIIHSDRGSQYTSQI